MLVPLVLTMLAAVPDSSAVYSGRAGRLDVRVPRSDSAVTIDGRLDEAVWSSGAVLTGFSQYSPADGRPAADSTEVLVWYSATAIHFGIRAFESHGSVHATLADRDRISADDHVQLLLGTFDDGRQATLLAVNPFGVQADGALVETGSTSGNGFNNAVVRREAADLSPDYVFESKGRLTANGYEVEVRVPFKSLRFQPKAEQRWGLNVVRVVQHSGAEDSWAPARRARASFLAQSGRLVGLTDLRRGLVLDLTPSLTSRTTGARDAGGWRYDGGAPDVGGTVRWGITNNLTLNGTANPDFSQVESDAGQVLFDPRDERFFTEKRPFFLEGIEQFTVPNNLIYSRRIVQPEAAAKITGKALGTDLAFLSALDDRAASRDGTDHPLYNILRLQRDVGAGSRIGVVYTDRVAGGDYNRVAGADARLVFSEVWSAQLQVAGSRTRVARETHTAPLWFGRLTRNGRTFGFRATFSGSDEEFRALSGFFPRPGVVRTTFNPRISIYGRPGTLLESVTTDLNLDANWRADDLFSGQDDEERKAHLNVNATLRGGWQVGASYLVESFGFPEEVYADYRLERPRAGGGLDTVAFVGRPRIPNRDYVLQVETPEFSHLSGNALVLWGHDENFFEWASGAIVFGNAGLTWRPTDRLRLDGTYALQQVRRRRDGSMVNVQHIPRLRLEYQVSRPLFVRLVGEYATERQDSLRDDARSLAPILVANPSGGFVRTRAFDHRTFRGDLLVSYQPTPGTVLFAGYASTLENPDLDGIRGLRREADGFFLKASYLFRL